MSESVAYIDDQQVVNEALSESALQSEIIGEITPSKPSFRVLHAEEIVEEEEYVEETVYEEQISHPAGKIQPLCVILRTHHLIMYGFTFIIRWVIVSNPVATVSSTAAGTVKDNNAPKERTFYAGSSVMQGPGRYSGTADKVNPYHRPCERLQLKLFDDFSSRYCAGYHPTYMVHSARAGVQSSNRPQLQEISKESTESECILRANRL